MEDCPPEATLCHLVAKDYLSLPSQSVRLRLTLESKELQSYEPTAACSSALSCVSTSFFCNLCPHICNFLGISSLIKHKPL
uniref:Uncharacterized protein MANES_S079200 n=1 Tax=Rhizophora mucronata TaxID=61149 RepID=A0A2P2L3F2_RHIMU